MHLATATKAQLASCSASSWASILQQQQCDSIHLSKTTIPHVESWQDWGPNILMVTSVITIITIEDDQVAAATLSVTP